jgi:HCOMODA/2-hydroxy-3-carboxy-muconic semialdehyde decarboxylase
MNQANPTLLAELADANRILASQHVVDAFGHVSVRHDTLQDHFLLARNMAPGNVTPDDILTFGLDGEPIDAGGRAVYLERFIHSEIYRVRPDVMSIVHSHSMSVVPFSISQGTKLRAVCHMGGFLTCEVPNFEIRDVCGGGSDLLIRDTASGAGLARSLGDGAVVLMRGHGSTVVAASLRLAVLRAVYTEVNARAQMQALQLGPVTYLTQEECEAATGSVGGQVNRAWDYWKAETRRTAGA